ncbi:hypothetical protein OGZ37_13050 [Lactococcus lactis]|uniref:hypothetical protein n=1 Tax=Lactococcus lactis TaxID=1358 RepID=UPI002418314E|nr:hypothetical protein [Lactococcus lactis]MDG4967485.1 hypothetical protein [Lactococcus lactis]
MKKIIKISMISILPLMLLSSCKVNDDKKTLSTKKEPKISNQENQTKEKGMSKSQILKIVATQNKETQKTPLKYNSGETTGMIKKEGVESPPQYLEIQVPNGWKKIEGQSDNAYNISKSSGSAVVDIWTAPSIKEDKKDPILGIGWMTSDEVLQDYFQKQDEKAEVFKKKIGRNEYSLATTSIPKGNQDIISYCIINDDGNTSSASILTNIILYDKMSTEDKLSVIGEVEGMLSQIEIKLN